MIRNNLSTLLAERALKITKVANDTGISRNTITSTAQNDGKMIQLETINTLCQYLQITPKDFFEFIPFDLDFSLYLEDFKIINNVKQTDDIVNEAIVKPFEFDAFLKKTTNSQINGKTEKSFDLSVRSPNEISLFIDDRNNLLRYGEKEKPGDETILFEIYLSNSSTEKNYMIEQKTFNHLWNDELTPGFKTKVIDDIENQIILEFENKIQECFQKYPFQINWHNKYTNYKFSFDIPYSQNNETLDEKEIILTGKEILPF